MSVAAWFKVKDLVWGVVCVVAIAGEARADQVTALDAQTRNPLVLAPAPVKTSVYVSDLIANAPYCNGGVGKAPLATFTLATPRKNLKLSAPGADVILARVGRRVWCNTVASGNQAPVLQPDEWPAGRLEIFAGDYPGPGHTRQIGLVVEDLSRPRETAWGSDKQIPHRTLDKLPAEAGVEMVAVRARPAPNLPGTRRCGSPTPWQIMADKPSLVLELTRPLAGVRVYSPRAGVGVEIAGPITKDGRDVRVKCTEGDQRNLGRLEPGSYSVSFGVRRGQLPERAPLVIEGEGARHDPLAMTEAPSSLPLSERDVRSYFPFLDADSLRQDDALAAGLIARAPASLFAFVRSDLDGTLAKFDEPTMNGDKFFADRAANSDWPDGRRPAVEYPKHDEPVLIIGERRVLTTDGLVFQVDANDLLPEPAGAPLLPASARNPQIAFSHALTVAELTDKGLVTSYVSAHSAYQSCNRKWSGADQDRVDALDHVIETPSVLRQRRQLVAKIDRELDQHCAPTYKALNRTTDRVWRALIASRSSRRTAQVRSVQERLRKDLAATKSKPTPHS